MFTFFLFFPNNWTTSYKTFFFSLKQYLICNPAWPRIHNIPASVSQGYGDSCILSPTFG